jgi:hypothetical protein
LKSGSPVGVVRVRDVVLAVMSLQIRPADEPGDAVSDARSLRSPRERGESEHAEASAGLVPVTRVPGRRAQARFVVAR